jgi:hypothetical protein
MNHEKLIINNDGDKVRIIVHFFLNHNEPSYSVSLSICKKGKRKFNFLKYGDDYTYRSLSIEGRKEYVMNENLKIVPIEFINQAKMELYQLLKPLTKE